MSPEAVRFSGDQFEFVAEPLDNASGNESLSPKLTQNQLAFFSQRAGLLIHGLDSVGLRQLGDFEIARRATREVEQGSALASYEAWEHSTEPLTDEDPQQVLHNPTPSML